MESTWIEINLAMDPDDYRLLRKCANELNLTVQSLIHRNIEDFLKEQNGIGEENGHILKR